MASGFKSRPHVFIQVTYRDGEVKYKVRALNEDGTYSSRGDNDILRVDEIGRFDGYNEAQAERVLLNCKAGVYTGGATIAESLKLPDFVSTLPTSPRDRKTVFLSLEIDEQEEVFYAIAVSTGLKRTRIAQWLMLREEEIEHIDTAITDAARAELDLRIAKKLINHALCSNAPASIALTLYLTKVFCNWSEEGVDSSADVPHASTVRLITKHGRDLRVVPTNAH